MVRAMLFFLVTALVANIQQAEDMAIEPRYVRHHEKKDIAIAVLDVMAPVAL
jgi:hypothetical protein